MDCVCFRVRTSLDAVAVGFQLQGVGEDGLETPAIVRISCLTGGTSVPIRPELDSV
jgi:hypothetical protein